MHVQHCTAAARGLKVTAFDVSGWAEVVWCGVAGLGLTNKYQHTAADQFIVSVVPSSPARAHGAGATAAAVRS